MDIWVVCPTCSGKAIVKPGDFFFLHVGEENKVKVICPGCGFNKRLSATSNTVSSSSTAKGTRWFRLRIGGAVDPFFYLPLWLRTCFDGHTLWAYNLPHLDFLHTHIEAKLRERSGPEWSNNSLGSRLPRWMTAKKNRPALLKKIEELQGK